MCFVWIWEQTAIISLYNINWLVCITETEIVYCAVRTESLTYDKFRLKAMQPIQANQQAHTSLSLADVHVDWLFWSQHNLYRSYTAGADSSL